MDGMDDLIVDFLTETNEMLGDLDADLVTLEKNPNDQNLLSQIFRLVHTIKGTCGFLGLPRLETVAHKGEDVLGLFRDGTLEVTPEYVTLIFQCLDRIKFIVTELEANSKEPEGDDTELLEKLTAVYTSAGKSDADNMIPDDLNAFMSAGDLQDTEQTPEPDGAETATNGLEEDVIAFPDPEMSSTPELTEAEAATPENTAPQAAANSIANQSLRVNVDVLENLMTLVSELVLTRNQLLQILRMQNESDFTTPLQRLNHVVSDLQEGVMKTRMQPIGNAWAKLPRIIRDINLDLGKKIELEMLGQDTELDRQVLELIKDPLMHMVRNSADHGIGTPAERVTAGKPEIGKIRLHSYHEGGHIIITISDDGRGLSTERIKEKILSQKMATAAELEEMSLQQIQQFIFKAGFSTAAQVTSVSGRGVGMDVVRTNIEKIGGSIELKSTEGKGTTFTIKIPLTLAIVSALIVESARERFAIPQLAVRELVMTGASGKDNRIETIKGTPVFRLRDRLLPLVSLEDILKLSSDKPEAENAEEKQNREEDEAQFSNKYIVVTQVGVYMFGIIVDRVFDTEEIVIKPVAKILKDIQMFSGNTILGDGSVIMILDPAGIANSSGEIDSADTMESAAEESHMTSATEQTSLLLFEAGDGAPKAVPLELISRLEEIQITDIEHANGQMVIQYRDQLMSLLPFNETIKMDDLKHKPVLVFSDDNNAMGLIVDRIIDITEEHIDVQIAGHEETLGSAIIDGKATDVVNVFHFLQKHSAEWFKDHDDEPFANTEANGASHKKRRILLVEDSPFFRNMLTPLLTVAGYEVTTTSSAVDALKMCDTGVQFDVIVSDIEMPEMSGFEFAEKIKTDTNWQNTPLVALSSHATQQDKDRGLAAGFNQYIAKFDRDTLLNTLSQTLAE